MSDNVEEVNATNAVLQDREPIMSYKKGILAKVFINVWDSFEKKPVGLMLFGKEGSESSIYDIFNSTELRYFEMRNKRHLETGYIIPHTRVEKPEEEVGRKETLTDEQLTNILNDKFFTLRSFLSDVDSVPVVYRLLTLAEKMEKPVKTLDFIKSHLTEIQSFKPPVMEDNSEEE